MQTVLKKMYWVLCILEAWTAFEVCQYYWYFSIKNNFSPILFAVLISLNSHDFRISNNSEFHSLLLAKVDSYLNNVVSDERLLLNGKLSYFVEFKEKWTFRILGKTFFILEMTGMVSSLVLLNWDVLEFK